MIQITYSSDPIEVKNCAVVVYGQPGVFKTSLGFTATKPLLVDFDKGAKRALNRGDSVQVSTWADIEGITKEDLDPYETLIIDTVGRMLDALEIDIMAKNPKHAQTDGTLTLKGYGSLKKRYQVWIDTMRSYGIDVVLIAHQKEKEVNDVLVARPDVQGGSYSEVFKSADQVGYAYTDGGKRMLDFNPSDTHIGKNIINAEVFKVPDFNIEPMFLAGIIADVKEAMKTISEQGIVVQEAVAKWREAILPAATANEINKLIAVVNKIDEVPVKLQARQLLGDQAKSMDLVWDKTKKKYGPKPAEDPPEDETATTAEDEKATKRSFAQDVTTAADEKAATHEAEEKATKETKSSKADAPDNESITKKQLDASVENLAKDKSISKAEALAQGSDKGKDVVEVGEVKTIKEKFDQLAHDATRNLKKDMPQ